MRNILRWGILALAAGLLALLLYQAPEEKAALPGDSHAALGMLLLEQEQGLYVLAVSQDSPAERAGLHPGDYLIAPGREAMDLTQLNGLFERAEDCVQLILLRDEREIYVDLPLR